METNDEWIRSRTGISERRILREPGKASSDMAVQAIDIILRKKNLDPLEIDCIICATVTPDMIFPATANIIGDKIGAKMHLDLICPQPVVAFYLHFQQVQVLLKVVDIKK